MMQAINVAVPCEGRDGCRRVGTITLKLTQLARWKPAIEATAASAPEAGKHRMLLCRAKPAPTNLMTARTARTASESAELAGFDMSLVEESLRCTYEQRAQQHQAALDLALEMERIGQQLRDRPESTSSSPSQR